jgi:hypothetical protein
MQSCLGPQSTNSVSYVSTANQFLFQSSSLIQSIFPPTFMSSSSRPTDSMSGQRGPSNYDNEMELAYYPHLNLRRSVSEHSPISPLQSGYGTNVITSSGSQHFRRKPTRLSAGSLSSIEERQHLQPPEQQQTYIAYSPPALAPRSAPSIQTSFSNVAPIAPVESPAWPYPIQHREYLQPQYTNFSPVSSNPYDSWEYHSSPQRLRANTSYMTSPTSYANYPPPDVFEPTSESGRGWSGSSAPAAMQSPVAPTRAQGIPLRVSTRAESNFRRQSEAVDEFTSPSEFALFVEATSSLSINAIAPSNWSSPHAYPAPPPPPSRLLAPLPPLPHQQMRSHSSPAPFNRQVIRQPSRSQLIAEALVGLDHEDRMRAEAGILGLDEDDLTPDENDDDLPDYAQSQAEASARQRREASRRAQELDAAWSRARRRRG